jgi:hypothetical protein
MQGAKPEQLLKLDAGRKEFLQAWPTVLPGGNAILFASKGSNGDARIEALVPETRERRVLVERGTRPQYLPSGHLVSYRDGQLLAAAFDAERLTIGSPKPVIENMPEGGAGTPVADVSGSGALVYAPATATTRLVWVSREGTEESLAPEHGLYWNPRLAPGAAQLVVQVGGDLSTRDLTRGGGFTRATSVDLTGGAFPVWAPDGRVVFRSATGLRVLSAETGRTSEVIAGTDARDYPTSVSQDGERLVFGTTSPGETSSDLFIASLRGDPQIQSIVQTTAFEGGGRLSRDNQWIVYSSNERGRMEVFIAPFSKTDKVDKKVAVSTAGGTQAVWNPNGREIFYRNGDEMMSVAVTTTPALLLGSPQLLFDKHYAFGAGVTVPNYDVSPDGQRFLMVKEESGAGRLNVVLNWTEELNRLVPSK